MQSNRVGHTVSNCQLAHRAPNEPTTRDQLVQLALAGQQQQPQQQQQQQANQPLQQPCFSNPNCSQLHAGCHYCCPHGHHHHHAHHSVHNHSYHNQRRHTSDYLHLKPTNQNLIHKQTALGGHQYQHFNDCARLKQITQYALTDGDPQAQHNIAANQQQQQTSPSPSTLVQPAGGAPVVQNNHTLIMDCAHQRAHQQQFVAQPQSGQLLMLTAGGQNETPASLATCGVGEPAYEGPQFGPRVGGLISGGSPGDVSSQLAMGALALRDNPTPARSASFSTPSSPISRGQLLEQQQQRASMCQPMSPLSGPSLSPSSHLYSQTADQQQQQTMQGQHLQQQSPAYSTASSNSAASTSTNQTASLSSMSPSDALNLGINLEQYISKRNERERSRVRNVNDAFDNLKNSLPLDIERLQKRMSKVEILRTAIGYIRNLESLLDCKDQQPLGPNSSGNTSQQQQQVGTLSSQETQVFHELSSYLMAASASSESSPPPPPPTTTTTTTTTTTSESISSPPVHLGPVASPQASRTNRLINEDCAQNDRTATSPETTTSKTIPTEATTITTLYACKEDQRTYIGSPENHKFGRDILEDRLMVDDVKQQFQSGLHWFASQSQNDHTINQQTFDQTNQPQQTAAEPKANEDYFQPEYESFEGQQSGDFLYDFNRY